MGNGDSADLQNNRTFNLFQYVYDIRVVRTFEKHVEQTVVCRRCGQLGDCAV